jgi:hypothetical protein
MASADVEKPTEPAPAPAVPDYLASPNAVFGDEGVKWRYGRAPDYSKTRKVWEEGKLSSCMTLLTRGPSIVWQTHGSPVRRTMRLTYHVANRSHDHQGMAVGVTAKIT